MKGEIGELKLICVAIHNQNKFPDNWVGDNCVEVTVVFLVLSPTVLLPETWRQMGLFAGGNRVSHDGYEFMNRLYPQRFTDWLNGIPVYFYLVFTAVKLPVLTVVSFVVGLPLLFRRKLGDGRYFILFWFMLWVVFFFFPGGKFTRYYTTVLPAVLITSELAANAASHFSAPCADRRWVRSDSRSSRSKLSAWPLMAR